MRVPPAMADAASNAAAGAVRPAADARSAADIARETIKQLALRRLAPTPDNYARLWAEISGEPANAPAPAAAPREGSIATAEQGRTGEQHAWKDLVRDLLRRWEMRTPGWTQAQKRESFERLLAGVGNDNHRLAVRMASLMRAWGEGSAAQAQEQSAAGPAAGRAASVAVPGAVAAPSASDIPFEETRGFVRELLRYLVDDSAQSTPDPSGLGVDAAQLSTEVESARDFASLASLAPQLRALVLKMELSGRNQRELFQGLRGLLTLVVNNIEELVPDERWILGQLARLRDTLGKPLSPEGLTQADAALRSVIVKQGTLKKGLIEAQDAMKLLLSDFINRMGTMSSSTEGYSARVEKHVERIRRADDLSGLSDVVRALLDDTRAMQADAAKVHQDLQSAQARALEQEARARALEAELEHVSDLVRTDPLTGVLNRRGLADSSSVEFARMRRAGGKLALSVLDIDNFKKLNDSMGHAAGDQALRHLADVLRDTLRPTDVVARYGGEEFVILLPETGVEAGVEVMTRVQRALTRRFFLHGADQVLITFSAGVALWDGAESERELVQRADAAMYTAKQTGKNRVVAA